MIIIRFKKNEIVLQDDEEKIHEIQKKNNVCIRYLFS